MSFALRMVVDLQLYTIWTFLAPRLSRLRGELLDVGCGEMPYRSCLPADVRYVGIDVPQASAFGMTGNKAIMPFDGVTIPYKDASFDTVLCTEVLEHSAEPKQLIAEIKRVLKPGGQLIATVPFAARVHYSPYDLHRFTRHALEDMFSSFSAVRIEERGSDISVVANKLIVLALRLSRPSPRLALHLPILLLLLPATAVALLAAHAALLCRCGSTDDPLGYAITALKPGSTNLLAEDHTTT